MDKISFSKFKERMIKTAAVTKTPICCTFELTPRCNLDCKMCYVHNKESNSLKEMELPTNTWKRVFDEAYNSGMLFATLTGGECLLRSDFRELYLHLWNKRVYMTVFTNGILLDEEYVSFFKKYKPQKIQISL
jgi:MoaA/NifB/PqqE/SkfB family radical SAM enzyme